MTQLEARDFIGQVVTVNLDKISICQIITHCQMEIVGLPDPGTYRFLTPTKLERQRHLIHGTPITQNLIYGFEPHQGIHFVSAAKGAQMMVVKVDQQYWHQEALRTHREDRHHLSKPPLMGLDEWLVTAYQSYLGQFFYTLEKQPELLQESVLVESCQHDVVTLLRKAVHWLAGNSLPQPLRRAEIVEAAREYMTHCIHQAINLDELSQKVCASRRSLIYGFNDIYGMGPISYFKCLRLNRVRVALLEADPNLVTVAHVAHRWGFRSLGHFAKAYKGLFGESPSETLKSMNFSENAHPPAIAPLNCQTPASVTKEVRRSLLLSATTH